MNSQRDKHRQQFLLESMIPDYENFFTQKNTKGKGKSGFLKKIFRINLAPIILSLLICLIQYLPVYVTPLLTAEIIDLVSIAVSSGGMSEQLLNQLILYVAIIIFCLLLNVPTTIWRWRIVSKTIRRTSAGIKSSVVRKMQKLSLMFHKDMETGKVQSKFIKDTEEVDALLSYLMHQLLPNVLTLIVFVVISVVKNGVVSLFFLFMVPLNVFYTAVNYCNFRVFKTV